MMWGQVANRAALNPTVVVGTEHTLSHIGQAPGDLQPCRNWTEPIWQLVILTRSTNLTKGRTFMKSAQSFPPIQAMPI